MTIPSQSTTITDGAIGLASGALSDVWAFVGTCSSGTAGTVYSFASPTDVVSTLGYGPLSEMVAFTLARNGGSVYAVKVTSNVAATSSAVTATGTSPPTVTISGTATDTFSGRIEITTGGTRGTATFKFSLDGGDTYSAEILTAATYLMPNSGITIAFASGTYASDNVYTFTTTEPAFDATNLNTALDALINAGTTFDAVHVVGFPQGADNAAKATASAAIAAAVDAKLDTLANQQRWACAVTECGVVDNDATGDAALAAGFASTVAKQVSACADTCEVISPVTGRLYTRSVAWPYVAKLRQRPFSTPAHQVEGGELACSSIRRNEYTRNGLDTARLVTARTWPGKPGFFITRPKMLHAVPSDYDQFQFRMLIHKAARLAWVAFGRFQNKNTPTKSDGTIDEAYAKIIEAEVDKSLGDLVAGGHAQSVQSQVNRTINIMSTRTIKVKVRVKRYEVAEYLEIELGFQPAT